MNKGYSLEQIVNAVKGELVQSTNVSDVLHLMVDSRKVKDSASLFFALRGEKRDGHDFVEELLDKGIQNFVVDHYSDTWKRKEANFILVDDTLLALQALVQEHRSGYNLEVVGITGSNGKTVVKEWLAQLLENDKRMVRSPKSYNSQIGVPLSVWQLNEEHELAVFEAGISKPGEMERLEPIVKPTIGIFTNIGDAHGANFNNTAQKIEEKLKLFSNCKVLIYSSDHVGIQSVIDKLDYTEKELISWGEQAGSKVSLLAKEKKGATTFVELELGDVRETFEIPFVDDASIENSIHCIVTMHVLGYESKTIKERVLGLQPVIMRLQLNNGINGSTIINDTYNSDIGSLEIALDLLAQQKQNSKKTVILSDLLQTELQDQNLYKEVAVLVREKEITRFIGIGPQMSAHRSFFSEDAIFYEEVNSFLEDINKLDFRHETILVKGARSFGFERITKLLQQQAHETRLEINLNAISHNLDYFKSQVTKDTRIMAMVKAFSYGSGSFEIANLLQFHKIDYLAVAYADEGVELRKAGIKLPIMVMNPEDQAFDSILKYDLEPEIYSFRILEVLEKAIARNMTQDQKPVSIHLKLDTGMHRLGFEPGDIKELKEKLSNISGLKVRSVFSHLVASDEEKHDEFTQKQITLFRDLSQEIESIFDYEIVKHILNSSGVVRFPEAQFDMVRLGIGLYGVSSENEINRNIRNVSTLRTIVSQVKTVKAGDTIGYGRRGMIDTESRIATLPIGYADGLNRRLGEGRGSVWINGNLVPTVGSVCMDMTMVDVTGTNIQEGDEVEVFGDNRPIGDLAEQLDTIPYEILTSVSRRVKRVYYQE